MAREALFSSARRVLLALSASLREREASIWGLGEVVSWGGKVRARLRGYFARSDSNGE